MRIIIEKSLCAILYPRYTNATSMQFSLRQRKMAMTQWELLQRTESVVSTVIDVA